MACKESRDEHRLHRARRGSIVPKPHFATGLDCMAGVECQLAPSFSRLGAHFVRLQPPQFSTRVLDQVSNGSRDPKATPQFRAPGCTRTTRYPQEVRGRRILPLSVTIASRDTASQTWKMPFQFSCSHVQRDRGVGVAVGQIADEHQQPFARPLVGCGIDALGFALSATRRCSNTGTASRP